MPNKKMLIIDYSNYDFKTILIKFLNTIAYLSNNDKLLFPNHQ